MDATGIKDPRQESNLRLVISTDCIANFRVNSLPFTAEGGVGGGAQINLVSKAGTNSFHGSAYEFFRNSALDARRLVDGVDPPPFRLNQFGANLGGPIIKNKTFFFANYEGLLQRLTISRVDGLVPSASFRQRTPQALQSLIKLYPVGNAPGPNANVDRLFNDHSGMARVDHHIDDKQSLFFRIAMADGLVSQIRNGSRSGLQPLGTHPLRCSQNFRGSSHPWVSSMQPTTFIIEKPSTYSIVDNLPWIRERHTIKLGDEIRRIHLNVGNGPATSVSFASLDAFLRKFA